MIATALRAYLEVSLLLALALGLWAAARRALTLLGRRPRPDASLRLGRMLLLAALALPLLVRLPAELVPRAVAPPAIAARTWAWIGALPAAAEATRKVKRLPLTAWPPRSDERSRRALAAFAVSAALLGLARVGWSAGRLRRHLQALPVRRRQGRVVLAVAMTGSVPYAARSRRRAWVVLPADVRPEALPLMVAHELQHHRQGDTRWALWLQVLRAASICNPVVAYWIRSLARAEELACDAAVVGRGRASSRDYARFLVEQAARAPYRPVVPLASTAVSTPSLLRRRIEMLLDERPLRRAPVTTVAAACLMALAGAAVLAQPGDRGSSVSADELQALVAARASRFEVPANTVVLNELNALLSTPRSRQQLRAGLVRMAARQPMIETALKKADLPLELKAVPLVESGYRNFESDPGIPESPRGAGLWMFIASTARRYDLRVDAHRDDRLNPALETEAAARMLGDLHREFGDWGLALAAYNQGPVAVRTAVEATGTKDALTLIESRRLLPYAGTVMAAVLLIENPALLERE